MVSPIGSGSDYLNLPPLPPAAEETAQANEAESLMIEQDILSGPDFNSNDPASLQNPLNKLSPYNTDPNNPLSSNGP